MRDPNRIPEILKRLEKLWQKYPDLRLGQLISNVFADPYDFEDEYFMDELEDFYNDHGNWSD